MVETTYTVSGMTCGHCASAVEKELKTIESVEAVAVDVESGNVTVSSAQPLEIAAVRAAIDEAGYTLQDS